MVSNWYKGIYLGRSHFQTDGLFENLKIAFLVRSNPKYRQLIRSLLELYSPRWAVDDSPRCRATSFWILYFLLLNCTSGRESVVFERRGIEIWAGNTWRFYVVLVGTVNEEMRNVEICHYQIDVEVSVPPTICVRSSRCNKKDRYWMRSGMGNLIVAVQFFRGGIFKTPLYMFKRKGFLATKSTSSLLPPSCVTTAKC